MASTADRPERRPRRWLRRAGLAALAAVGLVALGYAVGRSLLGFPPPMPLPDRGAVFSDVAVHVPGRAPLRHREVVVRGGVIASIGPARPVDGDPWIGATILPGFNDLHVHWPPPALPSQARLFALLHLRHGVTAVRSMGDNFEGASTTVRAAVDEGRWPGPRVATCGPFVDGDPPLWRGSRVVREPADAEAIVDAIADAGFDCVKAYDELDEASAIAVREAAHARGLPVVGHTPRAARFERVAYDDFQHLRGLHPKRPGERVADYPFFLETWLEADEAHLRHIRDESLRLGSAHTPTLVTIDRLLASRDAERLREDPVYRLLPRWYVGALWDPAIGLNAARLLDDEDFDRVAAAFERMQQAVGHLHAAGVPIHVGTDTLAPGVVPGAGFHRELELLVASGLGPEQALAAATRVGGARLGVPGLGEIRVGAPAELLVFERDPNHDLESLASLAAVVRDGRLYTREDLDRRIERFRQVFDAPGHARGVTGGLRLVLGVVLDSLYEGQLAAEDAERSASGGGS